MMRGPRGGADRRGGPAHAVAQALLRQRIEVGRHGVAVAIAAQFRTGVLAGEPKDIREIGRQKRAVPRHQEQGQHRESPAGKPVGDASMLHRAEMNIARLECQPALPPTALPGCVTDFGPFAIRTSGRGRLRKCFRPSPIRIALPAWLIDSSSPNGQRELPGKCGTRPQAVGAACVNQPPRNPNVPNPQARNALRAAP